MSDAVYAVYVEEQGYLVQFETESYEVHVGDILTVADLWQWNTEPIAVPVAVSVVTDDLLKKTISPIIFIDGSPFSWYELGVRQDKTAGTLDFTGYTLGNGEISGNIYLQYKG